MNWDEIDLVIFDADGTLRRRVDGEDKAPLAPDEWEIMPGIEKVIDEFRFSAKLFGIASNQACVFRGEIGYADALGMLMSLNRALKLNAKIMMCNHEPGTCACRKPEPGMLYAIMMHWGVPARKTLVVGDSEVDMLAAQNAKCKFMWTEQFLELGKE